MSRSIAAAIAAAVVTASPALAQLDEGDIGLSIIDGQIVTSLLAEEEGEEEEEEGPIVFVPSRVFIGEIGIVEFEPADDEFGGGTDVFQDILPEVSSFSTNTPGFDSGPGVFTPGALVGFSIINGLQLYDPTTDTFVSAELTEDAATLGGGDGTRGGIVDESLSVVFNTTIFQTGTDATSIEPQSLATPFGGLPTFPNGRFHRHWNFTFLPIAPDGLSSDAEPGVYAIQLVMTTDEAGVADSEPFFILFPLGVSEDSPELAAAAALANRTVDPTDFDGSGDFDVFDVLAFLVAADAAS